MNGTYKPQEGNTLLCSSTVLRLYQLLASGTFRLRLRQLVMRMENGPAYSLTIREILRKFYQVSIGLYTAGPCVVSPRFFQPGTAIGRYSAIAESVRTFTRNHTTSTKSTHGLFDNPALGKVKTDLIPWGNLVIGNGVWIGHNAIILPPTERIGDGAIIAAGSVVYTNVPPYAIASGFPARVTGYRFSKEIIAELLASRWWENSPAELDAKRQFSKGIWDRCDAGNIVPRNQERT